MIAVLFATLEEAAPFCTLLGADADSPFPVSVYRWGLRVTVSISGMGPEAAATATRHLASMGHIRLLINAGICGALREDLIFSPGAVFCIESVRGVAENALDVSSDSKPLGCGPWDALPVARLVTTPQPVFDPNRRAFLSGFGDLVDMEGNAVASVAAGAGIPCTLLKGVSDLAGTADRETLHRNLSWVSGRLAVHLIEGIRRWAGEKETSGHGIFGLSENSGKGGTGRAAGRPGGHGPHRGSSAGSGASPGTGRL